MSAVPAAATVKASQKRRAERSALREFQYLGGARRGPRQHLVLGDEVAAEADIESRIRGDKVLNLARSGETWGSLARRLGDDITTWQMVADAEGLHLGSVIIWLAGNDVYPPGVHHWYPPAMCVDAEEMRIIRLTAKAVAARLSCLAERVLILGPLARLSAEGEDRRWESSAAYALDRCLWQVTFSGAVLVVPLGRHLTRRMGKLHGLKGTAHWFAADGRGLTAEGYEKLADSFPLSLTLRKSCERDADRGRQPR